MHASICPYASSRWEFALKLAGFKAFSKTQLPRFFFPQIMCAKIQSTLPMDSPRSPIPPHPGVLFKRFFVLTALAALQIGTN